MTVFFQAAQDIQISTRPSRAQYQYTLTSTNAADVTEWADKLTTELRNNSMMREVASEAQEGAPRDLYERPGDAFVARFMGDANRVTGKLVRRDDGVADVDIGGARIALAHRGVREGDVALSIRPESITLGAAGSSPLAGTIRKAAYLGNVMEYTVDTAIGELFVVSHAVNTPRAAGAAVAVHLAAHGVVVIPG